MGAQENLSGKPVIWISPERSERKCGWASPSHDAEEKIRTPTASYQWQNVQFICNSFLFFHLLSPNLQTFPYFPHIPLALTLLFQWKTRGCRTFVSLLPLTSSPSSALQLTSPSLSLVSHNCNLLSFCYIQKWWEDLLIRPHKHPICFPLSSSFRVCSLKDHRNRLETGSLALSLALSDLVSYFPKITLLKHKCHQTLLLLRSPKMTSQVL